jgi:hypothetical protein
MLGLFVFDTFFCSICIKNSKNGIKDTTMGIFVFSFIEAMVSQPFLFAAHLFGKTSLAAHSNI